MLFHMTGKSHLFIPSSQSDCNFIAGGIRARLILVWRGNKRKEVAFSFRSLFYSHPVKSAELRLIFRCSVCTKGLY